MKKLISLFFILALAACSHKKSATETVPDEMAFWMNRSSSKLLAKAQQAVVVQGSLRESVEVQVIRFEKTDAGWRKISPPFPGGIGKKGFAEPGEKREGDKKTPTGIFSLSLVFGYAPSTDTRMPYRQATEEDYWVDDPESPLYNQWVKGKPVAASMEKMRRSDHQYELGIVVKYNEDPIVKGMGSAIFVHVRKAPGAGSAGCITLEKSALEKIISWLDPEKHPVILLGTETHLKKL